MSGVGVVVGLGVGVVAGLGVGVGVGLGVGVAGWTTTTTGTRVARDGVTGVGGTSGTSDGSTEGAAVGAIDGVGVALGCVVGSADGPGAIGVAVGTGSPSDGVVLGTAGLEAGCVGTGETTAVSGVGPPAVEGGVDRPEMPKLSATVASTRFTTPSARTRRIRCAAVKGIRDSWYRRAEHQPPPRGDGSTAAAEDGPGASADQARSTISSGS